MLQDHLTHQLLQVEYVKEKFNINVGYTMNPSGLKRVSPPTQKLLPPPFKPLSSKKAQLIEASMQPTVAMMLQERCPIHNVVHPNGCPNEICNTNEPEASTHHRDASRSTLSTSDDGERNLIITSPGDPNVIK